MTTKSTTRRQRTNTVVNANAVDSATANAVDSATANAVDDDDAGVNAVDSANVNAVDDDSANAVDDDSANTVDSATANAVDSATAGATAEIIRFEKLTNHQILLPSTGQTWWHKGKDLKVSSFSLASEIVNDECITVTTTENGCGNETIPGTETRVKIDLSRFSVGGIRYFAYLGIASMLNARAGLARTYSAKNAPITGRQFLEDNVDDVKKKSQYSYLTDGKKRRKEYQVPEQVIQALTVLFIGWRDLPAEQQQKVGYKPGMTAMEWLRATGRDNESEITKLVSGPRMAAILSRINKLENSDMF